MIELNWNVCAAQPAIPNPNQQTTSEKVTDSPETEHRAQVKVHSQSNQLKANLRGQYKPVAEPRVSHFLKPTVIHLPQHKNVMSSCEGFL